MIYIFIYCIRLYAYVGIYNYIHIYIYIHSHESYITMGSEWYVLTMARKHFFCKLCLAEDIVGAALLHQLRDTVLGRTMAPYGGCASDITSHQLISGKHPSIDRGIKKKKKTSTVCHRKNLSGSCRFSLESSDVNIPHSYQ